MKKYALLVLCAVLLFGLTGCGSSKKQVSCSQKVDEDGVNMTVRMIADLDKDDKITGLSVEYEFASKEVASAYCEIFKADDDSVSCNGNKITVKGFDDEEEAAAIIGKAKDEFISYGQAQGYSCK